MPEPEDIQAMLSVANIEKIRNARLRADNKIQVEIAGQPVETNFLGAGGTKEAYRVRLQEEDYVLAVCRTGLEPQILADNWHTALREPKNTQQLRDLGFFTNPVCRMIKIRLNGYDFPALLMKPFDRLGLRVFDRNNREHNNNPLIRPGEAVDVNRCATLFTEIVREVAALVNHGASLGTDSFNLCLDGEKKLHLYLSDLPYRDMLGRLPKSTRATTQKYLKHAIEAFSASFSRETLQKIPYLQELGQPASESYRTLFERLYQKTEALLSP